MQCGGASLPAFHALNHAFETPKHYVQIEGRRRLLNRRRDSREREGRENVASSAANTGFSTHPQDSVPRRLEQYQARDGVHAIAQHLAGHAAQRGIRIMRPRRSVFGDRGAPRVFSSASPHLRHDTRLLRVEHDDSERSGRRLFQIGPQSGAEAAPRGVEREERVTATLSQSRGQRGLPDPAGRRRGAGRSRDEAAARPASVHGRASCTPPLRSDKATAHLAGGIIPQSGSPDVGGDRSRGRGRLLYNGGTLGEEPRQKAERARELLMRERRACRGHGEGGAMFNLYMLG